MFEKIALKYNAQNKLPLEFACLQNGLSLGHGSW